MDKDLNGIKLDWLSFTYRADVSRILDTGKTDWELFYEDFPEISKRISEFIEMDNYKMSSSRFYDHVIILTDNVRISYCVPDGKFEDAHQNGVLVEVPSHGLEWFFSAFGCKNVPSLLQTIVSRSAKISRIDLCFDDYTKKYSPFFYSMCFNSYKDEIEMYGNFKYCMSTNATSGDYKFSKQTGADTFYLGSRRTGKMLRIYDKSVQSNGEIDAIRYEFELHGSYAMGMAEHIISNKGLKGIYAYLKGYFTIREKKYDKEHKATNPVFEEWENWLKNQTFANSSEVAQPIAIPKYTATERKKSLFSFATSNGVMNAVRGYIYCFGAEEFLEMVMKNGNIKDKVFNFYRRYHFEDTSLTWEDIA